MIRHAPPCAVASLMIPMIQPPFTTRLVTRLGGGHTAVSTGGSAPGRAIRVTAIAGGADRKQAAAVPAGFLTKRRVHGAAADDRRCHWTPVPFRGTNRAAALVAWSTRWSRGPGGSVRVPTSFTVASAYLSRSPRSNLTAVVCRTDRRVHGGAPRPLRGLGAVVQKQQSGLSGVVDPGRELRVSTRPPTQLS